MVFQILHLRIEYINLLKIKTFLFISEYMIIISIMLIKVYLLIICYIYITDTYIFIIYNNTLNQFILKYYHLNKFTFLITKYMI